MTPAFHDDRIDFGHGRKDVGRDCCGTAGHDQSGIGMGAAQAEVA